MTRTNVYNTTSNSLDDLVGIASGIFTPRWGGCSAGWTLTLVFSGSTLSGTPVNETYGLQVDTSPPPPPPPLDPEQTTGDASPWHSPQGDPVDSLTGAFNYHPDRADLAYEARGGGVGLARSYASDATRANRFGLGWSDSADAKLVVDGVTGKVAYHDPSGSTQVFTKTGLSYAPPLGVRSALKASGSGWTLTLKDQTVYSFGSNGLLVSILDRSGQGTTLSWNAGRLSSVSGSGRTVTLSYNAAGLVSGLTGSDGRSVAYEYDATGQLHLFTDAAGFTTTYGYDANGLLASVQDPNGNFPIRSTYDSSTGRVTQQQGPDGQMSRFGWTQSGSDSRTGNAAVTDARGMTITDAYESGYLVSRTDPDGNISRFVWDGDAQLSSTVDQLGNTTTFGYDGNGNLALRRGPDFASETFAYNSKNDIAASTDFNGRKSTFSYDPAGNLATVSRASIAGAASPVVSMRYTYNVDGTLQAASDALGRTTQYGYNTNGDLTSTTSPEGRVTTAAVDAAGRTLSTVEARGNVAGADAATYRSTQAWDALDRISSTVDALGHTSATVFDPGGRVSYTVDAKGGRVTYSYGSSASPLTVQGSDPAIAPQRYTYDPNGNIATATSSAGVTTTYTYTASNTQRTVSSSGTGTWTYDYDAAGRLSKSTAPSNRTMTLMRTSKGQVSKLTYNDGTPPVTYTFDAAGNRKSMADARGFTSYSYNVINKVTSVTSGTAAFQYTYDEAGQLSTRTLPDGSAATQYAYDRDSRLTSVKSGSATLAAYTYSNATGAVTTALPGGVVSTLQIDAARRPVSTQAQKGTTTLTRSQYTLDELGNPTKILNADGSSDSYAYSPQSRLLAVCFNAATCSPSTSTAAFRYSFDGDGNITSVIQPTGTTTYVYDSAGRAISRSGLKGAVTYQYDADGNTTSDGAATYTWNAASQLAKVTAGSSTTSYTYDGDNHRTSSTVSRTTTTSSYDPLNGSLALEQSGTKTLRRYDYGLGLLSMTAGTAANSYITDALGSVRGVTSSTGTLTHSYSYNPFGDTRATTIGKTALQNPLQFTGAYLTTPLLQMGARDYNPVDGRFLAPDPAGIPGRGDTYAGGNPMANLDPSGLSDYDWREMVNQLAEGTAGVAGVVAVTCTIALVICGEVVPIAAPLSWAASAVAVATSEQTDSCLSGHSSSPEALVSAAIVAGAGKFGMGGAAGSLATRATTIHSVLDPIARNSRSTAVLSTNQGVNVLAAGGRDLSPAQRALAGVDDIVATSPRAHAEVTAVNGALNAGLTPKGLGISRPICGSCQDFLKQSGATITSPTTAWWW
ncbi:RHS repeat-associated core domain-containing protein [Cryobacterium psychrophilum]|uniref:RHS repeat protein n=1 Tax=Cryobacterium psychrophilum TaxID=41988 RepID=A0A4Y8KNA4_9MICO|nr:RHS repeat-associated core domain-containing protein [Cryobacterium psychrophilum]TFD78601.1 hypothetical protein E3T53_10515 [Cryobacterium psychrophilum]